jgi:hypothetical protein
MIVESRCAMRMVICVLRAEISRTVAVICSSVSESSAEVASSKIRRRGSRTSARAIDSRCFSPPESFMPRSPMGVSSPSGDFSARYAHEACRMASRISSSVASGFTSCRFSRIVPAKRCVSCVTKPICRRAWL